jgi:hypothetical protein
MVYPVVGRGIRLIGPCRPTTRHPTTLATMATRAFEKVRPHRPRQNNAPPPGRHRQGTLTLTGSNVRLGTEMPVALSLFP